MAMILMMMMMTVMMMIMMMKMTKDQRFYFTDSVPDTLDSFSCIHK